nr:MAG TPA: hypothetical protein [Bacteriophage sp.]
MFVEFKNLNVAFRREFPLAIVYLNKCDGERFLREQGIAKSGSFSSFIPLIAIVDFVPQKIGCEIVFTNYRILNKKEEEDALAVFKRSNLTINDKGFISFLDYKKICFEVDGNILPYDDFCKYELPEGQVFKMVFDNGYSYYGSEPFKGDAKKYADTAIKVAEKLGYLWFSWTMGFRLNNLLNVNVVYGKDESYSVVSNT